MKNINFHLKLKSEFTLLLISALFLLPGSLCAQQITYRSLLHQVDEPHVYVDELQFPTPDTQAVKLAVTFHIDYELLQFKKTNSTNPDAGNKKSNASFRSNASVNLEVFTTKQSDKKNLQSVNLSFLTPVLRRYWSKTVYAGTYQKTQSKRRYVSGHMSASLSPGNYLYRIEINRISGDKASYSKTRSIKISPPGSSDSHPFYFIDSLQQKPRPESAAIVNYGNNIRYGKDFHLLTPLPSAEAMNYKLQVHRLRISHRDTTTGEKLFEKQIHSKHILSGMYPEMTSDKDELTLKFNYESGISRHYALLKIPNSTFPNAIYRISLVDEKGRTVGHQRYQSHWINMPVSLLNVGVALRMLRFIVEPKKLNKMQSGSEKERIQAFKRFWEEKDPTPNTAYNELMAEYYRRIDQAYEKFSSVNQLGFNTDRGKVYIRRGSPQKVERKFPSGQKAIEIWHYPKMKLIFRATSGFGDFKLISRQKS